MLGDSEMPGQMPCMAGNLAAGARLEKAALACSVQAWQPACIEVAEAPQQIMPPTVRDFVLGTDDVLGKVLFGEALCLTPSGPAHASRCLLGERCECLC